MRAHIIDAGKPARSRNGAGGHLASDCENPPSAVDAATPRTLEHSGRPRSSILALPSLSCGAFGGAHWALGLSGGKCGTAYARRPRVVEPRSPPATRRGRPRTHHPPGRSLNAARSSARPRFHCPCGAPRRVLGGRWHSIRRDQPSAVRRGPHAPRGQRGALRPRSGGRSPGALVASLPRELGGPWTGFALIGGAVHVRPRLVGARRVGACGGLFVGCSGVRVACYRRSPARDPAGVHPFRDRRGSCACAGTSCVRVDCGLAIPR